MKNILAAILLFPAAFAFAGPPSISHDWISYHSSLNASASQYMTDFGPLNNRFASWGSSERFNSTYLMYGFDIINGKPTENYDGKWDGTLTLEWMPSQEVTIGHNDSVSLRMRGWHLTTSSFGKDLIPGRMVALVVAPGIDWGGMKIFRVADGQKTKYKNPFVSPMARADLRFVFGKFSIGARAMYRYDITYDLWKRKADLMPVLPGTKFTGLAFHGFIGIDVGED